MAAPISCLCSGSPLHSARRASALSLHADRVRVHIEALSNLSCPLHNRYDTRSDMRFAKDAPVIGLVLQRSHLVTGDEGHYSGVVASLEAQGAKVPAALRHSDSMCWAVLQVASQSTSTVGHFA